MDDEHRNRGEHGGINDEGSYTAEDGDIEFTSTTVGDDFSGTVDDGTLEITYNFDGEAEADSQLTFEQ